MSKARDIADLDFNSPDIDGGNIDGATIGGTTPAAGAFTTIGIAGTTIVDSSRNMVNMGNITGAHGQFGSVDVDNISINGNEIDVGSGNLTLDVAGDIILDAGGAEVKLKDDGLQFGQIYTSSNNLYIQSSVSNKDLKFEVNDAGTILTALTLDGADAGKAIFNSGIKTGNNGYINIPTASSGNANISFDGSAFNITSNSSSANINFQTSSQTRMTLGVGGDLTTYPLAGNNVRFNSGVVDSDFTVSSDGYSHMFHVDGGNNSVSFGTSVDMGALVGIKPGVSAGTMYDALVLAGGVNSTAGSGARLYISGCANDPISRGTIIEGKMTDNGNSHELAFYTSGNSQAPTKKLTIASDGTATFTGNVVANDRLLINGATSNAQLSVKGKSNLRAQNVQVAVDGHIAIGFFNASGADVGGIGINASGASIALGGNAVANTLDDYEEGSWTPTVFNAGGSLTVSYNFQYGHYTKIGNLVQLYGSIRLNSASGGSGRAMIKGLPFTPDTALYACVGITHYNTALPGGGGADYKSNMIYDNGINFEVNSADQDTGEAIGSWEAGYISFSITYRTSQ